MAENRSHQESLLHSCGILYNERGQVTECSDVGRGHRGTGGEAQDSGRQSFGFRQTQANLWIRSAIRFHAVASRIKVATGQYVFYPEYLVEDISSNPGHPFINLDHYVLIVAVLIFQVPD